MTMKKKIRRTRGKAKRYFTKEHENAIIEYARTQDIKVRSELYNKFIQPVFNEMVDKIVYTYKFTNLPNIEVLKDDCKIWLTTILNKFDPSKGSKAFSYFSVITKNWFIHQVKKNTNQKKREVHYESISSAIDNEKIVVLNRYHELREAKEFWISLESQIEIWESEDLRDNERKVVEAIKIVLKEKDSIEIFNKKAIYLYLREITGLNTKQIVNNLNKIRKKYRIFKKKWDTD